MDSLKILRHSNVMYYFRRYEDDFYLHINDTVQNAYDIEIDKLMTYQ